MKILISHSWQDKSLATHVYEELTQDGHEVWHDILQLLPGDNIQRVIDAYIHKCDAMVLLWSINAFASDGVDAEIETATAAEKRIIPLLLDNTPLDHHAKLKGILGIPMTDPKEGVFHLRRALVMLMNADFKIDADWLHEGIKLSNELGGYVNYVNNYRVPKDLNEDGNKELWEARLTKLNDKNDKMRNEVMPALEVFMQELQGIMKVLEHGDVNKEQLQTWLEWCDKNEGHGPDMVKKLRGFILKDLDRLNKGGEPVHHIDFEAMNQSTHELDEVIQSKKQEANDMMYNKISSYLGWLLGKNYINSVVKSYESFVVSSPQRMFVLIEEAKISESVAVHETVHELHKYLSKQNRQKELNLKGFDGLIDAAYFIHKVCELLVESGLVNQRLFPKDPNSNELVNKYISYVIDPNIKERLDKKLSTIREMIGLKKEEINWGQVAVLTLGAAVVVGGIASVLGSSDEGASAMGGGTFEDNAASAGLDPYS